jgi:hypothetical protein
VKNGSETDIDCGGVICGACVATKTCIVAADCVDKVCSGAPTTCKAATCSDAAKNGTETDVDCGGACAVKCANGKGCGNSADCVSLNCNNGTCAAATCSDTIKNQSESDIDCGGPNCPKCVTGKVCGSSNDCVSLNCNGGLCAAPTCIDGIKNQGESDTDCSGPCAKCVTGQTCGLGSDCQSQVCTNNFCAAASCSDVIKNGVETDVDCGGGSCSGCGTGNACVQGTDCVSKVCVSLLCIAATCSDVVQNGSETDVDCGGAICVKCADTKKCVAGTDCQSGICSNGLCAVPTCSDGVKNGAETGVDCGGGTCLKCDGDATCTKGGDCQHGICTVGGSCLSLACNNGVQDAGETGVDCGGPCAICPAIIVLGGNNAAGILGASYAPSAAAEVTGSWATSGAVLSGTKTLDTVALAINKLGQGVGMVRVAAAGGTNNEVQYTTWTTGSPPTWAAFANIGGSAKTDLAPTLASTPGGNVHAAYRINGDTHFNFAIFNVSWNPTAENVGVNPAQSAGVAPPCLAELPGGNDTLVYINGVGTPYGLFSRDRVASVWAAEQTVAGAGSKLNAPTVVAMTAGASELLAAYVDNASGKIFYTFRTGGSWSAPASLTALALTTTLPVSIEALPNGKAVIAFNSGNKLYVSFYDGAAWSTPVSIFPAVNIAGAPTVAHGVASVVAELVYIDSAGNSNKLFHTRCPSLGAGGNCTAWSAAVKISDTAMDSVTIATAP